VPLTPPKSASCRTEITAAALVAFVGSVIFAMVGLVIAGTVAMTIFVFKRKYPGVSIYSGEPDSLEAR
jgi:hypothetical protein